MFYFSEMLHGATMGRPIEPTKRRQHCTFCKNHNLRTPKNGHRCKYRDCTCPYCLLTRKAQKAMRHQQRLWRHQKTQLNKNGTSSTDGQGFTQEDLQLAGLTSRQVIFNKVY